MGVRLFFPREGWGKSVPLFFSVDVICCNKFYQLAYFMHVKTGLVIVDVIFCNKF